jgi:hypothetical protein
MSLAFLCVVFAGFARTYYLRPYFDTPLLHLHGLVFTSWIVLLLAQAALVAAKRTPLRRIASHPLRLAVGNAPAGLAFATWLTGLVG